MEEYICQAFTTLVPLSDASDCDKSLASSQLVENTSFAADSAAAQIGADDVSSWVNVIYFVTFILGAGFVWCLARNLL